MNRNIVAIIVVIAVVLGVAGVWYFWASSPPSAETRDSVIVAYSPFESGALFWIAKDQHYFEKNGINLTLIKYDSGAASLDGVIKGEADIAIGVTEFPLVRKALQNERVRAIGNIDKGEFIYLVARKDRIRNETDLRGKSIGTTAGTVAEFHLGRFLTLHGMTLQDITLVDVKTPTGWVNDVADGKIDAISTAQPYANAARNGWVPMQQSGPCKAASLSLPWRSLQMTGSHNTLTSPAVPQLPGPGRGLYPHSPGRIPGDHAEPARPRSRIYGHGLAAEPVLPDPRPVACPGNGR